MSIQSQIMDTISRAIPEPRFRPGQAIGQAEVMFNDKLNQTLTNVMGQPRLERLKTQNPITAYRMLKQPYKESGANEDAQFFTDSPPILDTYNPINTNQYIGSNKNQQQLEYLDESKVAPNALPAQLDLGNVLVVDAPGQKWNRIQYDTIEDQGILDHLEQQGYDVNGTNPNKAYGTSTDAIVQAAKDLGYDSVHFKGLVDLGGYRDLSIDELKATNDGQSNIYAIINGSKIRAQTAMGDPRKRDENNILAELGLGIGAAGGAVAAAGNQDILDTIS